MMKKNYNMPLPLRILCVFSRLDRGGSESMCMELYRNMDRNKVQFDFVKHTLDKCAFEDEILSFGGKIFQAPKYKFYNHFAYIKWWKKHLCEHPEHQIIHGHYFTIPGIYFRVAKSLGRTTLAHSHATHSKLNTLKARLKFILCKGIENYADHVFACSTPAGDWVFPRMGYTVLHNAIDTKKFTFSPSVRANVRKELGIENCFIVGTVGNIAPIKNPCGILKIIKVCKTLRSDFRFLWIGGGGKLKTEIQHKLEQDGLSDIVIMTGVRTDIERLLQAMDVFILPSISEELPIAAIEAQAVGLPCLLSDAVSDEAVLTNNCSKLPLDDYSIWGQKLMQVDPTLRTGDTQAIYDAGYDINSTAKWLQAFYLQL